MDSPARDESEPRTGEGPGPAAAAGDTIGPERSRSEESEVRARRAREAADPAVLLSRVAGGLAHEIKNPLSTMAIHVALLREEFERAAAARDPQNPEPSARELRCLKRVQTLEREIHRLELIVEDFLVYARGGVVNRGPADIRTIVREVLEFVELEDSQAGIRHHLELPTNLPLVMLDESAFRQALLNLCVNARQAMPDGGELIVQLRRRGNFVELLVTDTGVGITQENLGRIFTEYWSTKKTGTGLGLSTVKRVIEQHQGTIDVVSEPGRGTSFSIVLPLIVEVTGSARPGGDEQGNVPLDVAASVRKRSRDVPDTEESEPIEEAEESP